MKRSLLASTGFLNQQLLPSGRRKSSSIRFSPLYSIVRIILVIAIVFFGLHVVAQPTDSSNKNAEYKKVITERSAKIINTLNLTDSIVYNKALELLATQYIHLNKVHDEAKSSIRQLKSQAADSESGPAIRKVEDEKERQLTKLHDQFIKALQANLTPAQIEKIKDGVTYGVLPVTYTAYQDMIPALTVAQKEKIYSWLVEAREKAMDQGSSEEKHKVFGKYKGRINNYLSEEGYDLKKEEKGWQERRRQSK